MAWHRDLAQTVGGWMVQCAQLLGPLYQLIEKQLLISRVSGTDDTLRRGAAHQEN